MPFLRIDSGTVRGVERTPQGGLRVDAAITRVGVLRYRDAKGREWGELRPAEEVFAEDSLKTLRDAPVTVGHPSGPVTTENWSQLARGHVGDMPKAEGPYVVAPVVVQHADAVAAIEGKKLRDVSAGYMCELDPTPGVFNGQRYDAVQRNIRYNHAAVLPEGAGRAGTEVSLRLDGAAMEVSAPRNDSADAKESDAMKTITFRGKLYRIDSAAEMAALRADVDAAMAEAKKPTAPPASAAKSDGDPAQLEDLKNQVMTLLQTIAVMAAQAQAAAASEEEAEGDTEVAPEVLDAAIVVREKLRADAKSILGDTFDPAKKSNDEIRAAVLAKLSPELKLDAKDAAGKPVHDSKTREAMFDAAMAGFRAAQPASRADEFGEVHRFVTKGAEKNASEKSLEQVRQDAHAAEVQRGRKPLG
jgi:hypothetical protein